MRHIHISESLGKLSLAESSGADSSTSSSAQNLSSTQNPNPGKKTSSKPTLQANSKKKTKSKASAKLKSNSKKSPKKPEAQIPTPIPNSILAPVAKSKLSKFTQFTKFKSKKILFGLIPATLLLLFFLLPNLIFKNKILPKTTFAGQALSSNKQEAFQQINNQLDGYKLNLSYQNQSKSFTPQELGFSPQIEQSQQALSAKLNSYRFWQKPFELFKSRNIEAKFSYSEPKLKEFLKINYSDGRLPEDAKVEFNTDQNKFIVVPEVSGLGIDSKKLASELQLKLSKLDSSQLNLTISNVNPDILADNLTQPLSLANSYLQNKISFQTPQKSYSPSSSELKDWIVLTPEPANSSYQVKFSQAKSDAYLDNLAKKLNRKMEKRLVANIEGGEILLQEGISGQQVSNLSSAKSQLYSLLLSAKSGTINLEFSEQAAPTENIAASGGRWIFADISKFRVYAYEGANLVNSFPMSSGKSSTPTPTGNYSVLRKVRVKTMTGGRPGTADYYSVPNIEWVAYFKAGGYAMHGVYWHNKFGVENTSHGCMGMSNNDAQWVYNFVDIGTPVIIVS